jgi:opacity protein-like surface antigen
LELGGFVPYVKAGIGLSINSIGALHNFGYYNGGNYQTYLSGATTTSFAWDAGIGTNYYFNDKLSVGLGYCFVDVGRLTTSNAFFLNKSPLTIQPLQTSHVFLNEVVASVTYHFDYI